MSTGLDENPPFMFYLNLNPVNWTAARELCASTGGYLAVKTSQTEQTAVVNLLQDTVDAVWLNGYYDTKKSWTWMKGGAVELH